MEILQSFSHLTLTSDQLNAIEKINAFLNSDNKIFILRGYAGSGKTTLIKGIADYLNRRERNYLLMAPTGRAAKVLRNKTGHHAYTIHKSIYCFDELAVSKEVGDDPDDIQLKYIFPLKSMEDSKYQSHPPVCIVDEASMISNQQVNNELLQFGSDNLLQDLLTYALSLPKGKIIFIGDPAQLPPVTDSHSWALEPDFFNQQQLPTEMYEICEIVRQNDESKVLSFARQIRSIMGNNPKERNKLTLTPDNHEIFYRDPASLVSDYLQLNADLSASKCAIICFSNALANNYNREIRQKLGYVPEKIERGELLMVVKNNYANSAGIELFNGDTIKIVDVSPTDETFQVPVYIKTNGKKEKIMVPLHFRNVSFTTEEGVLKHMIMLTNLLHTRQPNLSIEEVKALYINFRMRHPHLKEKSDEFKNTLRDDPWFNALRVKFSYAITCHKAQGGEWKDALIDFTGRIGLNNDCLRWIYTASTRARERIFATAIPNITPLSKMTFAPIARISKPSPEALVFPVLPPTPWHETSTMDCKRKKYFDTCELLVNTPYSIQRVKSNPYLEEYFIQYESLEYRFDTMHDGAGFFKPFTTKVTTPEAQALLTLLNTPQTISYEYRYTPSAASFDQLYQHVQNAILETEIQITNICETPGNYYITYYLKTSGNFACIQFYFDGSKTITKAMPKSDLGENDPLLQLLIQKLS